MLGIIAGTGLNNFFNQEGDSATLINTPFGKTSGELHKININKQEALFLPRHGANHSVPPHLINYRANIWALKEYGATHIIAIAAVGGITKDMSPGRLVLTDQIIDYTYGRAHTFFEEDFNPTQHIDFTQPYSKALSEKLLTAAKQSHVRLIDGGVYGCMQGPRLETAAEILKLKRDGCDVVGMTAMPEAALAREAELAYSNIAIVVNWAAGIHDEVISFNDIQAIAQQAEQQLSDIIKHINVF